MPVEEEGRLDDPVLRENFIERVFAYRRWQDLIANGLTPAALAKFHETHEPAFKSHDQARVRELGRLVADAGSADLCELAGTYIRTFMETLAILPTRKTAN